jgi:hypothetical protein
LASWGDRCGRARAPFGTERVLADLLGLMRRGAAENRTRIDVDAAENE